MAYSKDSIPKDHSEFGGGPGMIDPERRKDRVLENNERLMETYATEAYTEIAANEPLLDPETAPVPRGSAD